MSQLILTRHGYSLWNAANKFTGWVDVPLSERGRAEAMIAACKMDDEQIKIDVCFTSLLIRAIETAIICLTECEGVRNGKIPIIQHDINDPDWRGWNKYQGDPDEELPIFPSAALDERYYGDLQGLNKAETIEKFGAAQVQEWRRSYYTRPPGGESLEDTVKRVSVFYESKIIPYIEHGNHILIAAHGNSLRSLMMQLENLTPEQVPSLELVTGVPIVYNLDEKGTVTSKKILI